MATTYQFLGETNAVTYDAFGYTVLKKYIDVAVLVANPQLLALASAPTVPLSSFSGFAGASSDILQVFHVPAGFVAVGGGSYIQAADGTQTTASIALGDGDNTAGYQAAAALDGASLQYTIKTDAYGTDNVVMKGYVADDTIDILFGTQITVDAKFHVFIMGMKCFDITSVV